VDPLKKALSRRRPFNMMREKASRPPVGLKTLRGGIRGIMKGYASTSRPRFKTFKDRRKKKRAVSENEKTRRIKSMIFLEHVKDRIKRISIDRPTIKRINVGILKKKLQKR